MCPCRLERVSWPLDASVSAMIAYDLIFGAAAFAGLCAGVSDLFFHIVALPLMLLCSLHIIYPNSSLRPRLSNPRVFKGGGCGNAKWNWEYHMDNTIRGDGCSQWIGAAEIYDAM